MSFLLGVDARRASSVILLASTLLLPSTSHAFCRTTSEKLPPSYNPVNGCYTEGLLLFWRNACVGYSINQAASGSVPYEDAKRVIDASFQTWTNARCADGGPPGISAENLGPVECDEVRYNRTASNQNLIVFRDDTWPYRDSYSTLGLTTVSFDPETGEIRDADMEINGSGHNLSYTDELTGNGFDLASIVTHEAGHFFGLAHATAPGSTMYASAKPHTTTLRTLTQDDIEGLCTIYPKETIRSVSAALSSSETLASTACNPTPNRGLASTCVGTEAPDAESQSGCSTSPAPLGRGAVWATASLSIAACLLVLRRRRSARKRH